GTPRTPPTAIVPLASCCTDPETTQLDTLSLPDALPICSLSDDKSFTITVTNVNRPPTLVQPTDMTATEGSTADQTLTGFDPDAEDRKSAVEGGRGGMTVRTTTTTTGNVHLAPIAGDAKG